MKLKRMILENFRSYKQRTVIEFESGLTAFIGKNEAGKSTILEALDIFFAQGKTKIDPSDLSVGAENSKVLIGCVFSDYPHEVIIDSDCETTLADEFLLNSDGDLEIHKSYDLSVKNVREQVFAKCAHPSTEGLSDLLLLKQSELKKRMEQFGVEADKTRNASMRKAIWSSRPDLSLRETLIPLDKEGAKEVWDKLRSYLPLFALFKSDRESSDDDGEVQDPFKLAINEALQEQQTVINDIKAEVERRVTEVAIATLEKLKDFDEEIASQLKPQFRAEPSFGTSFKFSLVADDEIPINKRGSGVRRLILLSFFRAQAERRLAGLDTQDVIFAVEEPETSQHPNNQRLIVRSFLELVESGSSQIILTTHVPALAELLPTNSLRFIDVGDDGEKRVRSGSDDVYRAIAEALGVYQGSQQAKVVVCVEGPHDVLALTHFSRIISEKDPTIPDLDNDSSVVCLHVGGSTLVEWVKRDYLRKLRIPEYHIYDSDGQTPPKYGAAVQMVNARNDRSHAVLTLKREMENYLHAEAVSEGCEVTLPIDDVADVPRLLIAAKAETHPDMGNSASKKMLWTKALPYMTIERLTERDPRGEVTGWLRDIATIRDGGKV